MVLLTQSNVCFIGLRKRVVNKAQWELDFVLTLRGPAWY